MNRSTALFLAATAIGLPAWVIDVNALSGSVKAAWLAGLVSMGLAGVYYWIKDRA